MIYIVLRSFLLFANCWFIMFVAVVLIIFVCVSISYIISYYHKQLPLIRTADALPGPKTLPIVGNAFYFVQRKFEEFLDSVCWLTDTYPSPCRLWLGNKLIILTNEPDQIKTILRSPSCLNKSMLYNPFKAILGTGVFTAPAHIWATHRKMIAPNFNTNMLRVFCDTFVEKTSIFMEKLEHMINGEVDLLDHLTMYSFDNIFETLLGIQLESQSNVHDDPYINALLRLKEIILHRIRNIFLFPDIIFNLTPLNREQQKHLNFIHSSAAKIIQQKENARNNPNATKNEFAKPSRKVFLDMMMEVSDKGKKFTRKDLLDEIFTLISMATDTTAITINFTIFMLANFPEIQQKVYEELLEIYGTQNPKSTPVKFKDLQYMNYLECVLKETMRLFPTGPIIGRRVEEDLKIGKRIIPKDADVLIVILGLHRNEKYWPNALTFDPDRFLPENMDNIHPYSYIPFSNGPRNCLGELYAMTNMKVFIATLLRTYILKVDKRIEIEKIGLKMDVTLRSMKPLKIRIEKRK